MDKTIELRILVIHAFLSGMLFVLTLVEFIVIRKLYGIIIVFATIFELFILWMQYERCNEFL